MRINLRKFAEEEKNSSLAVNDVERMRRLEIFALWGARWDLIAEKAFLDLKFSP